VLAHQPDPPKRACSRHPPKVLSLADPAQLSISQEDDLTQPTGSRFLDVELNIFGFTLGTSLVDVLVTGGVCHCWIRWCKTNVSLRRCSEVTYFGTQISLS
jgi:hypothetical protein